MINKLTDSQELMLDKIAQEIIDKALGGDTSYDPEKIKEWIEFLYFLIKLPCPEIVICASPFHIFDVAKKEYGYTTEKESIDCNGIGYDAGWTSFYLAMEKIGVDFSDIPDFSKWKLLLETGVWGTLLFEKLAFICLRPSKVKVNSNDDLHCENGMAIEWIDGNGFYFLNGIRVPSWLVLTDSGKIDPTLALKEKNVDVQREIIRKVGAERMLKACNAKTLDIFIDNHTKGGNVYKLMEMSIGNNIQRKYLYYEHASLPNVWYAQPVHPATKKALHARALILGIVDHNLHGVQELETKTDEEIKQFLPLEVS